MIDVDYEVKHMTSQALHKRLVAANVLWYYSNNHLSYDAFHAYKYKRSAYLLELQERGEQ